MKTRVYTSDAGGQPRNNTGEQKKSSKASHSPRSSQKRSNKNAGRSRRKQSRRGSHGGSNRKKETRAKKEEDVIPALESGNIRIIPLGGVEEIGRNMTLIEYGDDIVVVDCGFQFREEETPGIDYILPNTKYLEDRKDKIRAVVITHGHLDHIGGIPYILDRIGNPPIYSRGLTNVMIKKRQEEFPDKPELQLHDVENDDVIPIGKHMRVRFFNVTHTIPDSMGVIVDTPHGAIVGTGDMKVDNEDGVPTKEEEAEFARFTDENVLLLMADSTNIEKPGWSIPERVVHENLERIISETDRRLIIGMFASQIDRVLKIIEIAERYGKKIVIDGRSMKNNVETVKQMGILKAKEGTIISIDEMDSYPPEKIVALVTGAQGDEYAALMRMSNRTHKFFQLSHRDTILLSASVVPGNERAVQKLKDNLARQGVHIIHYQMEEIHASGHGNREETTWMHKKVAPKFFMPQHGHHYMLRVHADLAETLGTPRENIVVPDNGSIIEIQNEGKNIVLRDEVAPANIRMVDGFSVGDIQEVVIRDRRALAEDGMFVIIATINLKTGKLRKSPDIISRGFVYLRESQELLQESRGIVKKTVEKTASNMQPIDVDFIKDRVSDEVSRHLFQKTNKRPIVIPVLIGV